MELPDKLKKTGLSEVSDEQLLSELMHRTYYEMYEVREKCEVVGRDLFEGNLVMIIRDSKV